MGENDPSTASSKSKSKQKEGESVSSNQLANTIHLKTKLGK
jgi:hypothetical protein